MTKFDDNLWRQMERTYGSELSETAGPIRRRSRRRRRAIGGTGVGVLGAIAATAIALGAANSSPAFAVTPHPDGTVSVVIRRLDGITGANQRLAQLGIHAQAVQVAGACRAAAALPPVAVAKLIQARHANWISSANGATRATIRPAQIPSGQTLIIPAVRVGKLVRLVHGRAVRGEVPACLHPAIQIWTGSKTATRVFACRPAGIVTPAAAPSQATNTTSTEGTARGVAGTTATRPTITGETGTSTEADTATGSGTGTATESGTATSSGTATEPGTGPVATAVPPNARLASPLLRACLQVAQRAASSR